VGQQQAPQRLVSCPGWSTNQPQGPLEGLA